MEGETKAIHSERDTCTATPELLDPAPREDPPPTATADGGCEPEDKIPEDADTVREPKRRKLCPSALEKCEAIIINACSNPSNGFSFTFDPKFSCGASTPEVTPKFGSFNLVAEAAVSTEIEDKSELEEEKTGDEEEVQEKRKILEILGHGDDGISAADYFEEGSNVFL